MLFCCYKLDFFQANFKGIDYSLDHHHHQDQLMEQLRIGETSADNNGNIDYMLNNPQQQQQMSSSGFCTTPSTSFDKPGFPDVMHFADPSSLNDKLEGQSLLLVPPSGIKNMKDIARVSDNAHFLKEDDVQNKKPIPEGKNKRKRPRTFKTSEEVESQRMTHIAVERNRRKQMNEHLRVLRSLLPGSYVKKGDQASIIGGAIEFVRELEQLLQSLESQKTRRLHGEASLQMGDSSSSKAIQQQQPLFRSLSLPKDQIELLDYDSNGLHEQTAESKSSLADVEVKLLGFDAMIKILSKTRPGLLVKTIAALEDLNLNLLHTNITTIEQTVLYSFNVKLASESRFSAEDIASSVQQSFSFIHSKSCI